MFSDLYVHQTFDDLVLLPSVDRKHHCCGGADLATFLQTKLQREDEVQKLTKEVEKLTKTLERNEKLAVLRDHIKLFRIDIAYKMHFGSWDALADKLYYESKGKRFSKPTHALLETTLTDNHLSMKLWNEVKEVADAGNSEFHKGKALDPKDVMQVLSDKWLPDDLVHTKHSLDQMLQFIDEEIAC